MECPETPVPTCHWFWAVIHLAGEARNTIFQQRNGEAAAAVVPPCCVSKRLPYVRLAQLVLVCLSLEYEGLDLPGFDALNVWIARLYDELGDLFLKSQVIGERLLFDLGRHGFERICLLILEAGCALTS